jgi:hypothetical protein
MPLPVSGLSKQLKSKNKKYEEKRTYLDAFFRCISKGLG